MNGAPVATVLVFATLAAASGFAEEDGTSRRPGKVEVTVFGGASLLDVGQSRTMPAPCPLAEPGVMSSAPFIDRPVMPDGFPPYYCPDITVSEGLGASFLLGTAVGFRITPRAVLEGSFSIAPSHDADESPYFGVFGPDTSIAAYHGDLALNYDLATGDVKPFVSLGFGRIEYGEASFLSDDEGDWSLNVGVGLSLKLAERARFRVDVVDHVVTDHLITGDTEHDVHVRLGVTLVP